MKNSKAMAIKIVFFSSLFFFSCKKEDMKSFQDFDNKHAMDSLSTIAAGKGEVVSFDTTLKNKIKLLSISEFKKVLTKFSEHKKFEANKSSLMLDSGYIKSNSIKSNELKSNDEYDLYDGPRPAGYYHVQFNYDSPLNQGIIGYYNLHLYFNTDANGRVIGIPTISYTGMGLFNWQQINISDIHFNANTYTSSFTITGNNIYGIQLGTLVMGWSSLASFLININMDQSASKPVTLLEQQ